MDTSPVYVYVLCKAVVLPAVKRTEKAMRNKLSVQQGEEGDEEDDEMDVSAKDKQWGKSKRGYYGADTEDYEVLVFLAQTAEGGSQIIIAVCANAEWVL